MKKFFLAALLVATIATSAFADENKVSSRVISNFKSDFTDAKNINWTAGKEFVRVTFVLNNEKLEAFYAFDGSLIATSKAIALDKLPESAVRYITKKYPFPPHKLKECIEMTDAEGTVKYYVSFVKEGKTKTILEVAENGGVHLYKEEKVK
jgi:hypothetical protein